MHILLSLFINKGVAAYSYDNTLTHTHYNNVYLRCDKLFKLMSTRFVTYNVQIKMTLITCDDVSL